MSAALAFSHGANDAQKSIGVVAALLLADGRIETLAAPLWAKLACAIALTAGTALGGWNIIRTVGRGIYRIRPVEGLASQASSAVVIFGPRSRALRHRRPRSSRRRSSASAGVAGDGTMCAGRWSAAWASRGRSRCRPTRRARRLRARPLAVDRMTPHHWFLPETPDVLGLLRRRSRSRSRVSTRSPRWAAGDAAAAEARARRRAPWRRGQARAARRGPRGVRDADRAGGRVRALPGHRSHAQLRRELVNESEAMACPPGRRIAEMAR